MSETPYRKQGERPSVPPELRRFYTKSSDVEKGPYEPAAIRRAIKEGHLRATTLVRAEDDTEWFPASEVTDIMRGVRPRARRSTPAPTTDAPVADDSTKTLVYGALACTLTCIGIVFAIMGISLAREQLRTNPGKYTRAGYRLSIVGLGIQLFMIITCAVILVVLSKGAPNH